MRYILFFAGAALLLLAAFASPKTISVSGQVTDAVTGIPLAQVSVAPAGAKHGVYTDEQGSFTLTVPTLPVRIVISQAGYAPQTIKVTDSTKKLQIGMVAAKAPLQEVVVTGYANDTDQEEWTPRAGRSAAAPVLSKSLSGRAAGITPYGQTGIYRDGPKKVKRGDAAEDEPYVQPGNTEGYDAIVENRFQKPADHPLSTFSIDVDGASYSNVRRLLRSGQWPTEGAVRIEEFINYFHYRYPQPQGKDPFSINTEIAACPWNANHKLVLIGLQGRKIPLENLPPSNLVFLIDVSGSMEEPQKLPLVQASLRLLTGQLRPIDKVSLVVYAGNAGLVLAPTAGNEKEKIRQAIDRLQAGGSTAGGEGIRLAYATAKENFVKAGNNRVILCTDGDFNVGPSSDSDLEGIITKERESGVFLTVLGYGMGNYQDAKMEKLADKGNGNHAYIDDMAEANKVLVNEFGGTMFTIAKDVKLQVEFNPALVGGYRLIGYENRMLQAEDFNNDKKDAGELGSGHTVTALYEIIPAGVRDTLLESVDKLKYQHPSAAPAAGGTGNDWCTIKFRYKQPDGNQSLLIEKAVANTIGETTPPVSENFRLASAAAQFGLLLRHSEFRENASFNGTLKLVLGTLDQDSEGYRSELAQLVRLARRMAPEHQGRPGEEAEEDKLSVR